MCSTDAVYWQSAYACAVDVETDTDRLRGSAMSTTDQNSMSKI